MAFLTMGTGMGAGLILDGRLYRGACDLAGEIGHCRLADDGPEGFGKRGSFEGFCSGGGIGRWAEEAGLGAMTAQQVFARADAGEVAALSLTERIGERLGQGIAMLIDILNLERIVIGSIFVRQRTRLWPAAERVLLREALPAALAACRIVPAQLGEAIGEYAACAAALKTSA
jgi:glucokinase